MKPLVVKESYYVILTKNIQPTFILQEEAPRKHSNHDNRSYQKIGQMLTTWRKKQNREHGGKGRREIAEKGRRSLSIVPRQSYRTC